MFRNVNEMYSWSQIFLGISSKIFGFLCSSIFDVHFFDSKNAVFEYQMTTYSKVSLMFEKLMFKFSSMFDKTVLYLHVSLNVGILEGLSNLATVRTKNHKIELQFEGLKIVQPNYLMWNCSHISLEILFEIWHRFYGHIYDSAGQEI